MREIPTALRRQLANEPWYKRCCLTGKTLTQGRIEWHHNFIYAGRQVNEEWCILPIIKYLHDREKEPEIGEKLDWIMLNRAGPEEIKQYGLEDKKERLNKKFGKWEKYGRYY